MYFYSKIEQNEQKLNQKSSILDNLTEYHWVFILNFAHEYINCVHIKVVVYDYYK